MATAKQVNQISQLITRTRITAPVTTEAEWVQTLEETGVLLPCDRNNLDPDLESFRLVDCWIIPGSYDLPVLNLGDGEKSVTQPYYSKFVAEHLQKKVISLYDRFAKDGRLFKTLSTRKVPLTSYLEPDSHKKVSYCHRKPDIVAREGGFPSRCLSRLSLKSLG